MYFCMRKQSALLPYLGAKRSHVLAIQNAKTDELGEEVLTDLSTKFLNQ